MAPSLWLRPSMALGTYFLLTWANRAWCMAPIWAAKGCATAVVGFRHRSRSPATIFFPFTKSRNSAGRLEMLNGLNVNGERTGAPPPPGHFASLSKQRGYQILLL